MDDFFSSLLRDKIMIWLCRIAGGAIVLAFIISFQDFRMAAIRGEHVKYLWIERNIPKGDNNKFDTPPTNKAIQNNAKNQNNGVNYGKMHIGDGK